MKGTFRRIVAGILMIAMILPITALAAEYNLDNGDITITTEASGAGDTYIQNVTQNQTTTQDAAPVITQTSESTSNTITVNAKGSQATVTIQGVNIEAVGEAAITTTGDVTIQVSGENAVSSDTVIPEGTAEATGGTAIEATGSLTITGAPGTEKPEEPKQASVTNKDAGTDDTTTAEEAPIVPENSLTVEGEKTAIAVKDNPSDSSDSSDSSDGNLIIGNGNSNDETKGDIEVTAVGGEVGIDANVTVDDGYLNAWGDVYGTTENSSNGKGIDGDLTVKEGAAAVYGDDFGVNGNVTVGTAESTETATQDESTPPAETVATAIVHSKRTPISETATNATVKTDSYVPEYSGTMYYSMQEESYGGNYPTFDIKGNFNNTLQSTTFSDDGYETYLKVGNRNAVYVNDFSGNTAYSDLKIQIEVKPDKGGQLLQIVYTVTNTTKDLITFDLGTGADVKIANDDDAKIEPLTGNSGFKMASTYQSDNGAQFNFFGKGYQGVTSVDGFWYGSWSREWYGHQKTTVFNTVPSESYQGTGDSAASWCWLDETIAGGEVKTYSVLIGIGGADSDKIAGDTTAGDDENNDNNGENNSGEGGPGIPAPMPEPEPAPAPAAPSSQLTIKLDTIKEVIDLASSTQDGKPMEKLEATSELASGKTLAPEDAIVVCKAETTADATVEDITKEDVAMAFTVAYLRKGVVSNMPGKVKLSIPAPADSLEGYVLVFVLENGKQIEIPYELIDGNVVFTTDRIGLYMIVKK